MPEKGWLKVVLEEARKDVNSRPDWQKNRVIAAENRSDNVVCEPQEPAKSQNR